MSNATESLKRRLNEILQSDIAANLYLVVNVEGKLTIKLADLENENTEPDIRQLFADALRTNVVNNTEKEVFSLLAADEHPNGIYKYDNDEYPERLSLFLDIDLESAIDFERFNFNMDDLSKLFGYIIYLGTMDDGVWLFKKHYPISLIKRGTFILGRIRDSTRLVKIEDTDILRLNGQVDLIKVDGEIFVLNINVLQRNFGYEKLLIKAAGDAIVAINDLEILENIKYLEDNVNQPSVFKKLSKILYSSPVLEGRVTSKDIIGYISNTKELRDKFTLSENNEKILLRNKTQLNNFLHLLNDDYFRSGLTSQFYVTTLKKPVE
jgi:hypothetical protein